MTKHREENLCFIKVVMSRLMFLIYSGLNTHFERFRAKLVADIPLKPRILLLVFNHINDLKCPGQQWIQ